MQTLIEQIPENIKSKLKTLNDNGFEAYIVGGAVRDLLLNTEPNDYDIFTNATGKQILEVFPNGVVIGAEERQKKILTVVVDGVEVSQYRQNGDRTEVGNNLKTHLSTCDFTINAIALGLDGELIDLYFGEDCLKNHYLRTVGSPYERIEEDKLRVLRAIRFMLKYNLMTDGELQEVILYSNIEDLPQERVTEELMKIIKYPKAIYALDAYGLLTQIFPELSEFYRLEGGEHHGETVLRHLTFAFEKACEISSDEHFKLACLLHDVGKGKTRDDTSGETHFLQHEVVGADLIEQIGTRLKWSTELISYLKFMVKRHMFGYMEEPSKKAYANLFAEMESLHIPIQHLVGMNYCDMQANLKKPRMGLLDFMINNKVHQKYYEMKYTKEPFKVMDLAIRGQDLLDLGMNPGVNVGKILNEAFDLVLDGVLLNNRAILMNWLRNRIQIRKDGKYG